MKIDLVLSIFVCAMVSAGFYYWGFDRGVKNAAEAFEVFLNDNKERKVNKVKKVSKVKKVKLVKKVSNDKPKRKVGRPKLNSNR